MNTDAGVFVPGKPFHPSLMFVGNNSGLYYKSFMIVIYDHNNSMIIEPVL